MARSDAVMQFVNDRLNSDERVTKNRCDQAIHEFCHCNEPYICIFGAGDNGKKLYYELMNRLIRVDCFSDNDSRKWGNVIEDIYCIPPSYLKYDQDHMLIVLTMDEGKEEVKKQMNDLGMEQVITGQELMNKLSEIPQIMPVGCIEKIDYTSLESNYLIGKFNKLIQDTCKYYEDKIDKLNREVESKT